MKRLLVVGAIALALTMFASMLLFTPATRAQGNYMSLGKVTQPVAITCPSGAGFATTASCFSTTVTECPSVGDLPLVYGVSNSGGVNGTIVLFSGHGGGQATDAPGSEQSYTTKYTSNGYQVVQFAWGWAGGFSGATDWELAFTDVYAPSIRNAACRPASFLNWVRNGNTLDNGTFVPGLWTKEGMCAQGFSAGAGAIAYALAWYGAGDALTGYLDRAELLSGPELADLMQGCAVPNNYSTEICQPDQHQFGCRNWTSQHAEEFTGANGAVEQWSGSTQYTGPAYCANNYLTTTYDDSWFRMSLMDTEDTQQPSFNYPKTTMAAWLCETTAS